MSAYALDKKLAIDMDFIKLAIERPTAIIAAVLMIIMFGLVALRTIPIQLTPDVRKPVISVRTSWVGAAPIEIEREIINRQEEALRGLEGLDKISSRSRDGRGSISLEFSGISIFIIFSFYQGFFLLFQLNLFSLK